MIKESEKKRGGEVFFSHGTKHSKSVCILINPTRQIQVNYSYADNSGRIVLITICLSGHKLTLCNIYAPNNQANQLQFMQQLNNCIIDKTEHTSLIAGVDWNGTLSQKEKIGCAPWRPTICSNLVFTIREMFDLVYNEKVRHSKLRNFTYESKSLKVKSRIDFVLVAKNLTLSLKSKKIYLAIVPDHYAISMSLSLPNLCPRGPAFWKFNNTPLNDEQYVTKVRDTYSKGRNYYCHLIDNRLFWEKIKIEIRSTTISYSKSKCKFIRDREKDILFKLDLLDNAMCNNCSSPAIDETL